MWFVSHKLSNINHEKHKKDKDTNIMIVKDLGD
jgi:hypothetical protein